MEARQNEIKTLWESVLQCGALWGLARNEKVHHKWKKAWTIINLPCLGFLPHFHAWEKNAPKLTCHYFLSTQEITSSQQINLAVYLPRVWKALWWTSASDEIINPDWKGINWKGNMKKQGAAVWTAWLLQINNLKERFSQKSVGKS